MGGTSMPQLLVLPCRRCLAVCYGSLSLGLLGTAPGVVAAVNPPAPWVRHTIDRSSEGADGVRLADANRDGSLDVVTGWEEGGRVRICFQPDSTHLRQPW